MMRKWMWKKITFPNEFFKRSCSNVSHLEFWSSFTEIIHRQALSRCCDGYTPLEVRIIISYMHLMQLYYKMASYKEISPYKGREEKANAFYDRLRPKLDINYFGMVRDVFETFSKIFDLLWGKYQKEWTDIIIFSY